MFKSKEDFVVLILDDDEEFIDALSLLLTMEGWDTQSFSVPEKFLEAYPPDKPCIVLLDAKMPNLSGVDVLEEITVKNPDNPVIFLTGHGDIDMAVYVLKNGACDFLQKPVIPENLFKAMNQAIERMNEKLLKTATEAYNSLTKSELRVLNKIQQGLNSRETGEALGMSARTVEAHKYRLMQKLDVHKVSDLITVVQRVRSSQNV